MRFRAALAVVSMSSAAALAHGGNPPAFLISFDASGDGQGPLVLTCDDFGGAVFGGDAWSCGGSAVEPTGLWEFRFDSVFNGDHAGAFITANIDVTNKASTTVSFAVEFSLSPGMAIRSPVHDGSLAGQLTDLTFDDATVSAPVDGSIYTALIDTTAEAFLLADPFSQNAGGPMFSNTVGPADFGIPDPVPPSQDVDDSIGIPLSFDLSPGDRVGFTAVYEITSTCPWDVDGGGVGITDFLALLAAWGPNPGHPADFDGDGNVGIVDFLELLANWGPCP